MTKPPDDLQRGGERAPSAHVGGALHGVLIVNKPSGPTSHDVVAGLRRSLRTRSVGHAGTLDPAATGVLVVAIGEATKLTPYLTSQDKSYEATVSLGSATTTLDAEGDVTSEESLPADLLEELRSLDERRDSDSPGTLLARAIDAELRREAQIPPAFSAIKQQGRPVHERARAGEAVELAPRPVRLRSVDLLGSEGQRLRMRLRVSKGYYVRSFARDFGEALGLPAHLSSLHRIASGAFSIEEAIAPSSPREALLAAIIPLAEAARRALPAATLTEAGVTRARQGKRLREDDFTAPPPSAIAAWFSPGGLLVAIGEPREDEEGGFAVRRGFAS